ncbi:hypothetical protein Gotri_008765, partial [Gossypium trilobum]|nr:hypothetical protein [Gossypium trilobum]
LTRSSKLAIVFGVGVPFSFILGLVIYLRGKVEDHQNLNPTASSVMVVKGLDGKILESYPITLLANGWANMDPKLSKAAHSIHHKRTGLPSKTHTTLRANKRTAVFEETKIGLLNPALSERHLEKTLLYFDRRRLKR